MIKRLLKISLVILLIVIIASVSFKINKGKKEVKEQVYTFSGIVDEVTATTITIKPSDEVAEKLTDKVVAHTSNLDFYKGDSVTVSYAKNDEEPDKIDVLKVEKNEYSKIVKLYITAIDNILSNVAKLDDNIMYLSVDTDSFVTYPSKNVANSKYPRINDEDENKILQYVTKYSKDVRKDSVEELKSKGVFEDGKEVVIYLENVAEFTENAAKFTLVKCTGNDTSLHMDYTLKYTENEWVITSVEENIK